MKNNYSDDELEFLILRMQNKEDDLVDARKAFEEIANEFHLFLCKNALYWYKSTDKDFQTTLVNNTLIRIYEGIHTFEPPNPKNGVTNNFKAWIVTIMKNQASEMFKKINERDKEILTGDFTFVELHVTPMDRILPITPKINLLREAIESVLTERGQEILRTYYMFKKGNAKLPSIEMERLKLKYSTTAANIRQIKGRSQKKVEKYIIDHPNFNKIFNKKNNLIYGK